MTSNSSKALPYVSIAVGFIMALFSILGYGDSLDKVVAFLGVVLPVTAGGGLVNKAIEASVEKKKAFLSDDSLKNTVKQVMSEIEEAAGKKTTP